MAVIGASHDPVKLGYAVLRNLLDPTTGYPVLSIESIPKRTPSLAVAATPLLWPVRPGRAAILVVPAAGVPAEVQICSRRGVKAAVIISGGFREVGKDGAALERQVVEIARRGRLRVMGPNCIGVMDTHTPLNTTSWAPCPLRSTSLSFAIGMSCGGIIDWIVGRRIGFSRAQHGTKPMR